MTDSPTPTTLDFSSLPAYLGSTSALIGQALAQALPDGEPRALLYDLARDYPQRGGKRFRPALLLLSCALVGGKPAQALPSAVALELFQNFALVHDDIEDGSLLRRGRPALHRIHGVPLAINAGDLLFGLIFEVLAQNESLLGAGTAWSVQREFSRVFRHTFEGQALDIGWAVSNHWPSRDEFETMIRLKTGWYSGRGPCRIGALIGGGSEKDIDDLGQCGELLGIGFQIRDDLLNLAPDTSQQPPGAFAGGYGKERGGDIAEGKRTLIIIELMKKLPAPDVARVEDILNAPAESTSPGDIEWVIATAERTGAIAEVRARCEALGQDARNLAEKLPPTPQRKLLAELTDYLMLDRWS